jgi:uncharacterized membrane protein YphA (DoxX/SURF4 family)
MSEERTLGQKVGTIVLWLITLAVAVPMLLAGSTKVLPDGMWPEMFAAWGYSTWFLYLIALVEVAGAIALLVPRFATYAAAVLAVVMAGAAFTLLTNPGDMGPTPAIANMVMLAIVGFMRRDVRWTPS